MSSFIFGLSATALSFHFSAEIFGWLFFLLFLGFLAEGTQEKTLSSRSNIVLALVLVAITLAHVVTQFMVFLVLLALFILGKIKKHKTVPLVLVVLSAALFCTWAIFAASDYISATLSAFGVASSRIMSDFTSSIIVRPVLEREPSDVANLVLFRRGIYILVGLTAFFGAYLQLNRIKKRINTRFLFLLALFIAGLVATPLTILGILPLERSLKLIFIPLSVFSAYFISQKKKVGALVIVFLLLTLPMNFASFYWSEASKMTHDWELDAARFVASYFHGAVLGEFKDTSIFSFYGNFSTVYNDYYLVGQKPNVFNYEYVKQNSIELVYVTQLTIMKESLAGRDLNKNLSANSVALDCIYSNGYSVFLHNRAR
jgi:hypothetical protein